MRDPFRPFDPFRLGAHRAGLSSLFAAGQPGHWPDSYDPVRGRLFQDAAGTIPVTAPGQPVGLVKRAGGSADASQGTALSRPTLGRWPRGGRRNMLQYSPADTGWEAKGASPPGVTNGVTHLGASCVAIGFDQTMPALHSNCRADHRPTNPIPVLSGTQYCGSAWVSLSRALTGTERLRLIFTSGGQTPVALVIDAGNSAALVGQWLRRDHAGAPTANASLFPSAYIYTALTSPVTLYVRDLQLETGAAASTYQRAVSDYDLTEAGVPDVWHLYNDGGDSLPITLPAGTYGRARVNTAGQVTVDTVVDPTDALSGTRQVDVILRQGAFTASEEAQIRAYWARYAP